MGKPVIIRYIREDVAALNAPAADYSKCFERIAKAIGIESPLQITASAENDEETTAEILTRLVEQFAKPAAEVQADTGGICECEHRIGQHGTDLMMLCAVEGCYCESVGYSRMPHDAKADTLDREAMWRLPDEDTPHDGPYLVQVIEHQECGNLWTFMAVRNTLMNRWVLSGGEVLVAWQFLPERYTQQETKGNG